MKLLDSLKFGGRRGFCAALKKHPINIMLRTVVGSVVALILAGAMTQTAEAAVYTRFDSAESLNNWGLSYRGNPPDTEAEVVSFQGENALRIMRRSVSGKDTSGSSAFVYYKGSDDGISDGKVADFELKSTIAIAFNPGASGVNSHFGLMFRASSATYLNSNGYYVSYNAKTFKDDDEAVIQSGALVLYDKPNAHNQPGTLLASVDLVLDLNTYYVFKITAVGTSIKASIWSEDESVLLGEFEYEDDAVRTNAGYFGTRTAYTNTNMTQYVKDISVTVIPEPTTVAFALIGGAAMLVVLRRRAA